MTFFGTTAQHATNITHRNSIKTPAMVSDSATRASPLGPGNGLILCDPR